MWGAKRTELTSRDCTALPTVIWYPTMNSPCASRNPYILAMPRAARKKIIITRKQKQQKQQPSRKAVAAKVAQPAKKGPNPIARGLLGVVSGGANMLLPGSGLLVNALGKKLLNSLGLSEKVVLPHDYNGGNLSGSDGGTIVASADAPVQFAREQSETSFLRYLHKGDQGDVIVHTREPLANVSTNAAANTLTVGYSALYPFNASLAIIKQVAGMYSWYRMLAVKLHYTHWAPTSTQTRVCIAHAPTETFNNGANVTIDEASKLEHAALGSAYEDFGLEFEPTCPLNWYPSYPTLAATTVLEKANGTIYVGTDLNNVLSATVGTLYIELVTAFKEQRPISVTVGSSLPLAGLVKRSSMLKLMNEVYRCFSEQVADRLFQMDPWELYDAIHRKRSIGTRYSSEYETMCALVERCLPKSTTTIDMPRASPFDMDAVSESVVSDDDSGEPEYAVKDIAKTPTQKQTLVSFPSIPSSGVRHVGTKP